MPVKDFSFLAFATFLCFAFACLLLIQGIGHYINVSMLHVSLPLSAIASFVLTYRYFFGFTRRNAIVFFGSAIALGLIGLLTIPILDMTYDGMGYHQPAAQAIMQGWNPLREDAALLWQRIYPTGAWELAASLGVLYNTIEATKMLSFWWLFIAFPFLFAGLRNQLTPSPAQTLLTFLTIFCPIVITQALTHYVDALIYLAGITFLGAMMLTGKDKKHDQLAWLIMASCVLFIVNAKLSGIYHAVTLCGCAVAFVWMEKKHFPLRPTVYLMSAGIIATLFLGFHPYVTNILTYGSLLHMDGNTFSGAQRPSNFEVMNNVGRFLFSLLSQTGGFPREPAPLKLPWQIIPTEFYEAGAPDSRTGGYGVLFALAYLCTGIMVLLSLPRLRESNRKLLVLSGLLLISSIAFPECWWARYVPFGYMSVLLLLLALPQPRHFLSHMAQGAIVAIFLANSFIAVQGTYIYIKRTQGDIAKLAEQLRKLPEGSVYLVPPGEDYQNYNSGYKTIIRRFATEGIMASVKVNAPCPHEVTEILEFRICY